MVRRGFKTTVIATVIAMMLSPNFSALAQTGKSNTLGSWKLENNAWVFLDGEGKQVKGWVVYNQEWYYLNPENGQLKMGWLQLDGKWYFLSTEAGAMQGRLLTGWQWIDGYCYYFYGNDDSRYGELLVNGRTPDGYYVNQSGHWLQGEGGEAVYEAGRGLSSTASEQQVAGASRALPGQVLGASRAIAAPGGGSFGGGGGGGSTGGGGTASTAGTTGNAAAGASAGAATGGSAAETTGTAGESATAGGATGASTGAEANANASTEAESNASVSTGETAGNANPSTEGTGADAGNEGTGASTNTENSGSETGGNAGENTGAETPSTGGEGSETAPSTDNTAGTETGAENGGNAGENTGSETGGNAEEKPGTENTGSTENPDTAVSPENPKKPETSETTEDPKKPETSETTEEPKKPETSEKVEEPKESEKPAEEDKKEEESLKDWPFEYRFEYDAEKKSFLLFFGESEDKKLVKEFLHRHVEVMVNDSHYELGDWTDDLTDAENKYIYALKWDITERGYFNALRLCRSAFHEGINTVEFAPDGYKPLVFNFKVKRGMLQELKKLEKLQYHFAEKVLPGSYDVKIVKFENLSEEQKAYISGLKTLEVDGVSYTNVEDQRYEDLCAGGRHAFMQLKGTYNFAIGNPPKEYGNHIITIKTEEYEDIELSYAKEKEKSAPVVKNLEKKEGQGLYELSFEGERAEVEKYLKKIKKLTVLEKEYGQMASFRPELLRMGEKFSFGDSESKQQVADLLLFSIPKANPDKKQEIRIESEGYELNIISLS